MSNLLQHALARALSEANPPVRTRRERFAMWRTTYRHRGRARVPMFPWLWWCLTGKYPKNLVCFVFGHRRWLFRRPRPQADRLRYFSCPRCGVALE